MILTDILECIATRTVMVVPAVRQMPRFCVQKKFFVTNYRLPINMAAPFGTKICTLLIPYISQVIPTFVLKEMFVMNL